jgi:hypothetical protein
MLKNAGSFIHEDFLEFLEIPLPHGNLPNNFPKPDQPAPLPSAKQRKLASNISNQEAENR